jgi:hypothetical protein
MDEKTLKLISLFSDYLKKNNESDNIEDDLKFHIKNILNESKSDEMVIQNKKCTCEYITYKKVYYRRELCEDNNVTWSVKHIVGGDSYSEITTQAYKNVLEYLYQKVNDDKNNIPNSIRKYNL